MRNCYESGESKNHQCDDEQLLVSKGRLKKNMAESNVARARRVEEGKKCTLKQIAAFRNLENSRNFDSQGLQSSPMKWSAQGIR